MTEVPKTLIFAHRGSRCNRPENTLAAFREAVRVGADGIETDVHLSVDGQLVVIHDETVNRTTNGRGKVRDLTVSQIKKLDAGSWFSDEYCGEQIPLLTELLSALTELNFTGFLNIEVKTDKYHYPDIEKKLSALMKSQTWPFQYIYSSFNLDSLKILSQIEPTAELAYLMKSNPKKIKIAQEADYISAIHLKKSYALRRGKKLSSSPLARMSFLAKSLKRQVGEASLTKPLRLWTVNADKDLQKAFQAQVAAVITDEPEKALHLREKFKS